MADDERARRYVLCALFGWTDRDTGHPLFGQDVLEWVGGRPFYDDWWGKDVIEHLRERFPAMEVRDYVSGKKPRL